jgi:hypothetical protein
MVDDLRLSLIIASLIMHERKRSQIISECHHRSYKKGDDRRMSLKNPSLISDYGGDVRLSQNIIIDQIRKDMISGI